MRCDVAELLQSLVVELARRRLDLANHEPSALDADHVEIAYRV
jgi:hypothetical protein